LQAEKIFSEMGILTNLAETRLLLGQLDEREANIDSALKYWNLAKELFVDAGADEGVRLVDRHIDRVKDSR
jgi:hypothetical protein